MKFKSHQFQNCERLVPKIKIPVKYNFEYRRKCYLTNSKQDYKIVPSKDKKKMEIALRILSGKAEEHITNYLLVVVISMLDLQASLVAR
jgi:hypothetical protein